LAEFQIAVYSFAVKDNGRIAIWAGATLIIVSVVAVSIRVAVIFLTGFVQASKGEIDQGWLQQAISGNLWATIRMFMIVAVGASLLSAGLLSRYRARRKIAIASAYVQLERGAC
jgi:hypothetical protein